MNFDHLDFPRSFDTPPDGYEHVQQRARTLKVRRRTGAVGGALVALVMLAGATSALSGGNGGSEDGVVAEADKTTTSIEATTTTVPASTTTIAGTPAPEGDSDTATPGSTPKPGATPGAGPSTGGGDAPAPGDDATNPAPGVSGWDALTVTWDAASYSVNSREQVTIAYTVRNAGASSVEIPDSTCTDDLVPAIPTAMWPMPVEADSFHCSQTGTRVIAAGGSARFEDVYVAGQRLAAGGVHPAPPGSYVYMAKPWTLAGRTGPTVPVTVNAPTATVAVWHFSRDSFTRPSGGHQDVMLTWENELGYAVRVWVPGPCFEDDAGDEEVECRPNGTLLTVPGWVTGNGAYMGEAAVQARVYAKTGFVSTGANLAPGAYSLVIGTQTFPFTVT